LSRSNGLVLAFHGLGGLPALWALAGEEISKNTDWTLIAPRGEQRSWNGRFCCGPALQHQSRDAEAMALLIKALGSPRNVYGIGFSNGAFFISEIAAFRQDQIKFRGVAPWAGYGYILNNSTGSIPIFLNHGDADGTVRASGCCPGHRTQCCCGIGEKWKEPCVSVNEVFDLWRQVNHCQDKKHSSYGRSISCFYGVNCQSNTTLCIHKGLGHIVPGLHQQHYRQPPLPPSSKITVSSTLEFFYDISKKYPPDHPKTTQSVVSNIRLLESNLIEMKRKEKRIKNRLKKQQAAVRDTQSPPSSSIVN